MLRIKGFLSSNCTSRPCFGQYPVRLSGMERWALTWHTWLEAKSGVLAIGQQLHPLSDLDMVPKVIWVSLQLLAGAAEHRWSHTFCLYRFLLDFSENSWAFIQILVTMKELVSVPLVSVIGDEEVGQNRLVINLEESQQCSCALLCSSGTIVV